MQVVDTVAKVLEEVTDEVKSSYHYGAPKFKNSCVVHTDDDCVTLIKRLYHDCDTIRKIS